MRRSILKLFLLVIGLTATACHPKTEEAKELRDQCEAGDAAACNTFAQRLQKGEQVLRDPVRAAALYDQACTGGVGAGCASLGIMLQEARPPEKDPRKNLGFLARDTVRPFSLFERGCELGAMEGC